MITESKSTSRDAGAGSDLFTRLKKLQALKNEGLVTEEEFEKLRRKAMEEAK